MTILRYPDKKIAVDVLDGRGGRHIGPDEQDWQVLRVTSKELESYATFRQIMGRLAEMAGTEIPSDPDSEARYRERHRAAYAGMAS